MGLLGTFWVAVAGREGAVGWWRAGSGLVGGTRVERAEVGKAYAVRLDCAFLVDLRRMAERFSLCLEVALSQLGSFVLLLRVLQGLMQPGQSELRGEEGPYPSVLIVLTALGSEVH